MITINNTTAVRDGRKNNSASPVRFSAFAQKNTALIFRRAVQFSLLAAAPVLVSCSDVCSRAAAEALRLCAETVVPSLFPYLILTSLISSSGAAQLIGRIAHRPFSAIFGIDGSLCSAFLIGTVSGYPAGAAAAAQLYGAGACEREEAERVLAFCNNTGPAFLIGGIGAGMLGSPMLGTVIYISQLSAALLCGILLRPRGRRKKTHAKIAPPERQSAARQFVHAVSGAGSTMLVICSFIVFFAVVGGLIELTLDSAGITSTAVHALLLSIFELTSGARAAADAGSAGALICSASVGWSGLSVLFQTMAVLEGSGLSVKYYVKGKALQAILCPVITALLLRVLSIV